MAKRRTFTAAIKARLAKEVLRADRTVRQISANTRVHPERMRQPRAAACYCRAAPSQGVGSASDEGSSSLSVPD